jgi:hypothetical protein
MKCEGCKEQEDRQAPDRPDAADVLPKVYSTTGIARDSLTLAARPSRVLQAYINPLRALRR